MGTVQFYNVTVRWMELITGAIVTLEGQSDGETASVQQESLSDRNREAVKNGLVQCSLTCV